MKKALALIDGTRNSALALYSMRYRFDVIAIHFFEKQVDRKYFTQLAQTMGAVKLYLVPLKQPFSFQTNLKKIEKIAQQETADVIITGKHVTEMDSTTLQAIQQEDSSTQLQIIRAIMPRTEKELKNLEKESGFAKIKPTQPQSLNSEQVIELEDTR